MKGVGATMGPGVRGQLGEGVAVMVEADVEIKVQ